MVEDLILSNLITNEGYGRKVIPFLRVEYFQNKIDKAIFNAISSYVEKYNKFPEVAAIFLDVKEQKGLNDEEIVMIQSRLDGFSKESSDVDWLVDQTEKYCKDKAVYNAIVSSIELLNDKDKKQSIDSIPHLLEEALSVSFETQIGHDFIDDYESRYDYYHKKEERIPFDIDYLNKITKGGLPKKTLNVVLAGTGVGKSLFMCHCAASALSGGKNVLYITMEMAEERIAERIDANLMNTSLDQISLLPRDVFEKKIAKIRDKTLGKLIIKEYPTSSAGSANFRHLLNELKRKKKFTPDLIFIDYLNICASSRVKMSAIVNSYTYVKAIAEELRGLAVEFNVPIVSATQTTRSGFTNSDIGLEDTSESFGLPATVDLMFAMIATEELEQLNQLMFKQLKNRYADLSQFKRFVVGVDKSKMKLYDVEQHAQENVMNDVHDISNDFSSDKVVKLSKDAFRGFS